MCVEPVTNSTIHVPNVAVNHCMTDTIGMSRRATFGQWLRATRLEHGLSQEALATQAGLNRTQVVNLEHTTTWPRDGTRAKYHAVFGTSDEDVVAFGAATRHVHHPQGKPARVSYAPTVRRGDHAAMDVVPGLDAVPVSVQEVLAEIPWTPKTTDIVTSLLEAVAKRERNATAEVAPNASGTPRSAPEQTGGRSSSESSSDTRRHPAGETSW